MNLAHNYQIFKEIGIGIFSDVYKFDPDWQFILVTYFFLTTLHYEKDNICINKQVDLTMITALPRKCLTATERSYKFILHTSELL